jgi:hypothetical protein
MEKISKAYEYWGYQDRMAFNPDGTMQQWLREEYKADGEEFEIFRRETEMKQKIKEFEEREERFKKRFGITFSEWDRPTRNLTPKQQEERQLAAIRDGEELSALPCAMDTDDYFDIKNDSRYL